MSGNERFKIFIAAYLILLDDDKILLLKRENTGYQDGNYSLIAGHLDGDETATQSIIREAKEEAGISLAEDDLEVVHVMHRKNPDREYIDVYLIARVWQGDVVNKEPHKCGGLDWCHVNALPENMVPEVRSAIEDVQKKCFYSEFGW